MNIKVCGITQMKQLQQLDGLNIDFAGLIFHEPSPRYAKNSITGREIIDADLDIRKVGVFVNTGYDEIMKMVEEYELDLVQLHGNEQPALCKKLSNETEVIKTFSISAANEEKIDELIAPYEEVCDYYLFDTAGEGNMAGGTGKKFNWQALQKSRIEKPFFLSGGIGVEDAATIKAMRHPDLFSIDINSRFEKTPGVKDMALILQLLQAMKKK
jgi:phosphoribosylanthranilate isomerase